MKNTKVSKHITLNTLGTLLRCYHCTLERDEKNKRYRIMYKGKHYVATYNARYMYVISFSKLDLDLTYSLRRVNNALFKYFATNHLFN